MKNDLSSAKYRRRHRIRTRIADLAAKAIVIYLSFLVLLALPFYMLGIWPVDVPAWTILGVVVLFTLGVLTEP